MFLQIFQLHRQVAKLSARRGGFGLHLGRPFLGLGGLYLIACTQDVSNLVHW